MREVQLMESLLQKLQGKSVYRTLSEVTSGKGRNKCRELIGLTSLLTHCLIECEQGNSEYLVLVEFVNTQIQLHLVDFMEV